MSTEYEAGEQWRYAASCNPNQRENDVFKMPTHWSDLLGLPNVGPTWGDYPITEAEFMRRQKQYGPTPLADTSRTSPRADPRS